MKFKILEELLEGSIRPNGYTFEEIDEAEQRLDIKFPPSLRYAYHKFGRNNIVNGQNYFIPPKHLKVHNEILVFFNENQACYRWFFKVLELKAGKTIIYGADDDGYTVQLGTDIEFFLFQECIIYSNRAFFSYRMVYNSLRLHNKDRLVSIFGPLRADNPSQGEQRIKWYWKDFSCIAMVIVEGFDATVHLYVESDQQCLDFIKNFGFRPWQVWHQRKVGKNSIERVRMYEDDFED